MPLDAAFPTATHHDGLLQTTPSRDSKSDGEASGVETADHCEPFHWRPAVRPPRLPTAMQNAVLMQLTPASWSEVGVGATVHDEPFHCSINDAPGEPPTATQKEVVVHETAAR
jgi:hypothetical protein